MKKTIVTLSIALCLAATAVHAQYIYDMNGRLVEQTSYVDVEGTPYLFDQWYTGIVKATKEGKIYDDVKLRYDAYKDELEYEKEGKFYRLGPEVTEFTIPTGDALYEFRRGFPAIGELNQNSFYRVLYDGNTKFLKRYKMRLREEKPYGSATVVKHFEPEESAYILKDGKMYQSRKNDKKGLLTLLADEKNLMNYIIKEEQLDFKTEEDTIKLLEEYDAYKAGREGDK